MTCSQSRAGDATQCCFSRHFSVSVQVFPFAVVSSIFWQKCLKFSSLTRSPMLDVVWSKSHKARGWAPVRLFLYMFSLSETMSYALISLCLLLKWVIIFVAFFSFQQRITIGYYACRFTCTTHRVRNTSKPSFPASARYCAKTVFCTTCISRVANWTF
jgi:hypothetical protein